VKSPGAPSAPSARSGLSAIGSAWWWLAAGLYALAIFLLAGQSYPLGIKHMPFLVDSVTGAIAASDLAVYVSGVLQGAGYTVTAIGAGISAVLLRSSQLTNAPIPPS